MYILQKIVVQVLFILFANQKVVFLWSEYYRIEKIWKTILKVSDIHCLVWKNTATISVCHYQKILLEQVFSTWTKHGPRACQLSHSGPWLGGVSFLWTWYVIFITIPSQHRRKILQIDWNDTNWCVFIYIMLLIRNVWV